MKREWIDEPSKQQPGSYRHAIWKQDGFNLCASLVEDHDADTSYLEQAGFEDRFEQYRRGDFGYCGVLVTASRAGILLATSMGLWGIETDSNTEYFDSVADEESADAIRQAVLTLAGFEAFLKERLKTKAGATPKCYGPHR